MVNDTIIVDGMTITEAEEKVMDLLVNEFGEDKVIDEMIRGKRNFRVKLHGTIVKVGQTEDNVVYTVENASNPLLAKIKGMATGSKIVERQVQEGADKREGRHAEQPQPEDVEEFEPRTSSESIREAPVPEAGAGSSNAVVQIYSDGSIRLYPRYRKEEAEYRLPDEKEQGSTKCEDCAHFIHGGGCHIVQGKIDPKGHCERFYSDVVFTFELGKRDPLNLTVWGRNSDERFEIHETAEEMQKMIDALERKIQSEFGI